MDKINNTVHMDKYELITDPDNKRFTISKIEYPKIWNLYKMQQNSFWKMEEIDFSKDLYSFNKLHSDEQYVIKMILGFFSNLDGIVNFNIGSVLLNKITILEASITYNFQMMMENIHNETYAMMLNTIITDTIEREFLFNSIKTIPSIARMANWAMKWIDDKIDIGTNLIAYICVEGILFSSSFATIFWLKHYKSELFPASSGLFKSNEFISNDEKLHYEFGIELYSMVNNKLSIDRVKEIIIEAVDISKDFSTNAIKCKLLGMNSIIMNQYIEYVADEIIVKLGYTKIFNTKNPFIFMDMLGMNQRTNFHESRPTEYSSAYDHKHIIDNSLDDEEF